MLAYAAGTPQAAVRRTSPKTLLLIAAAHVVALGMIITAKSDLPQRIVHTPIAVTLVPGPPPPPPTPNVTKPRIVQQPTDVAVPQPQPINQPQVPVADSTPRLPNIGELIGPGTQPPTAEPQPVVHTPAPTPAWLLTPTSELKPPYPEAKLLSGEEATLRLRLTIDEHGRVTAVDPIGAADRIFLDAARRYLMAHWRYSPATQAGQPVATSLVITLKFQLDG